MITEKTFYQYLKCPNWVYFDAHASEGRPHDPLLGKLIDEGLIEEKERAVISDRPDVAEVTSEDPEAAFNETLAFMREGRRTIYHGVLVDKHWVGHPDVLERVEGRSRFGNYYYVAADIKRARELRDDFKFQGCFYAELLHRIQEVKPVRGYVITPEAAVIPYLIEEFEATFHLTLDEIEAIVAGVKPTHFVTSSCKQSPWFSECKKASTACNDLSLLNRVWGEEIRRLDAAGLTTIDQLASKSIDQLERAVPDIHPGRLQMLRDHAVSLRNGVHTLRAKPDLPESRVELFFDIESDPLRDFDYLFGIVKVENGKEEYIPFLADYPDKEGENWRAFVQFIEGHHDAIIYHFGWYESEVVRRMAAKYGASSIAVGAFERNMIDLLVTVRSSVIFPLTFYSLKDIGAYIGFHWRSEDANGANSVLWFENWLRHKDESIRRKILEYNEDDCRATYVLQRWLREQSL